MIRKLLNWWKPKLDQFEVRRSHIDWAQLHENLSHRRIQRKLWVITITFFLWNQRNRNSKDLWKIIYWFGNRYHWASGHTRSSNLILHIFFTSLIPVSNSTSWELFSRFSIPFRMAATLFSLAQITNGNWNLSLYLRNRNHIISFDQSFVSISNL